MIFNQFSPKKKKRINAVALIIGVLALILGFIPGFFPYQWGLVIFVFSLVVVGIVTVILPDPEPDGEPEPENQNLPKPPV